MTDQQWLEFYEKGFEDFVKKNPEKFMAAVKNKNVSPGGGNPEMNFCEKMVERGRQLSFTT